MSIYEINGESTIIRCLCQEPSFHFVDEPEYHSLNLGCSAHFGLHLKWNNMDLVKFSRFDKIKSKIGIAPLILNVPSKSSNVWGEARPREIMAILSTSDTQHSTDMIKSLAGFYLDSKSLVLVNSMNLSIFAKKNFKTIVGFVDGHTFFLYNKTTVIEAIEFAEKICNVDPLYKNRILNITGLANFKDVIVGGYNLKSLKSKECRIRTAIALELLVGPPPILFLINCLFCQGGLDYFSSRQVIQTLNEVSKRMGITIILSTPRIPIKFLNLFHTVLLLDTASDSSIHTCFLLESKNLDRVLRLMGKNDYFNSNDGDYLENLPEFEKWPDDLPHCTHSTFIHTSQSYKITNIWLIYKREWINLSRNYTTFVLRALQTLISGLFFAFVFINFPPSGPIAISNRSGFLSYVATYWFVVVISSFPEDSAALLDIWSRERRRRRFASSNNKSLNIEKALLQKFFCFDSYYYGKTGILIPLLAFYFTELPILLIQVIIFCFLVFYIPSLENKSIISFIIFITTMSIQMGTNAAIGLFVGLISRKNSVSGFLRGIIILLGIIFGGFLAAPRTVTWILRWMNFLSPIYYAYRVLLRNELIQGSNTKELDLASVKKFFSDYSVMDFDFWVGWGALLGLTVLYLTLAFITAHFQTNLPR